MRGLLMDSHGPMFPVGSGRPLATLFEVCIAGH